MYRLLAVIATILLAPWPTLACEPAEAITDLRAELSRVGFQVGDQPVTRRHIKEVVFNTESATTFGVRGQETCWKAGDLEKIPDGVKDAPAEAVYLILQTDEGHPGLPTIAVGLWRTDLNELAQLWKNRVCSLVGCNSQLMFPTEEVNVTLHEGYVIPANVPDVKITFASATLTTDSGDRYVLLVHSQAVWTDRSKGQGLHTAGELLALILGLEAAS